MKLFLCYFLYFFAVLVLVTSLIAVAILFMAPVHAATITQVGEFDRSLKSVPLRLGDFTGVGPCGSGLSVETCGPKEVGAHQERFGRYSGEIDSQDMSEIIWAPKWQTERDRVQLSLSDLQDMTWTERVELALLDPTGVVSAVWESNARRSSGSLNFFEVAFDEALRKMVLRIRMIGNEPGTAQSGDGYGVGVCR